MNVRAGFAPLHAALTGETIGVRSELVAELRDRRARHLPTRFTIQALQRATEAELRAARG